MPKDSGVKKSNSWQCLVVNERGVCNVGSLLSSSQNSMAYLGYPRDIKLSIRDNNSLTKLFGRSIDREINPKLVDIVIIGS